MSHPIRQLKIIVPVFNDWPSFAILLRRLDTVARDLPCSLMVSAVDDGSTLVDTHLGDLASELTSICELEIIRLAVNMGHQRAIAIGLCVAAEESECDAVLTLDSDGEDRPESIPTLLARAAGMGDFCIVAARRKRSESLKFKASYILYKTLFRLVTGKRIRFGNFCLISASYVRRLVMIPDLWNNLPAAVLRSRLPIEELQVDRGTRYAGKSHMNFTSLVVHGLSAISVYADAIFVRLLLATVALVLLTVLAVTCTLALRVFVPAHATPGWATTVSFGMIIILLQVLFTAISSILMLLNSRIQRLVLPLFDYKPYVRVRERILPVQSKMVSGSVIAHLDEGLIAL